MLEIQKQNSSAQSEIYRYKVVLLGNMFVGKSSLVLRFVKGQFNPQQENTIGAAFLTQTLCFDDTTIRLDLWDTAGQERYESIVRFFYRGAEAAIVVYDITDELTFKGAKKWVTELRNQLGPESLIALAGNKQDLAKMRMVQYDEAQVYADENKLIFMETSAKTMVNVNEIFLAIAKKLPIKKNQRRNCDKGVQLSRRDTKPKTSGNCCK